VSGATLATSFVRVLPKDSGQRVKIAYADIAAIAFSGGILLPARAGKHGSQIWEKKESGEADLSLEPESWSRYYSTISLGPAHTPTYLSLINTIAYENSCLPSKAFLSWTTLHFVVLCL